MSSEPDNSSHHVVSRFVAHSEIHNRRLEENLCWRQHKTSKYNGLNSAGKDKSVSRLSHNTDRNVRNERKHHSRKRQRSRSRSSDNSDRLYNRQMKIKEMEKIDTKWKSDGFEEFHSRKNVSMFKKEVNEKIRSRSKKERKCYDQSTKKKKKKGKEKKYRWIERSENVD